MYDMFLESIVTILIVIAFSIFAWFIISALYKRYERKLHKKVDEIYATSKSGKELAERLREL